MTIDQERDELLPRTARDQKALAAALEDLRAASVASAKRALFAIAAGLLLLIGTRIAARRFFG